MPVCPKCGCSRLWKDGHYRNRQRFKCSNCFHRFIGSEIKLDISSQNVIQSDSTKDVSDRFVPSSSKEFLKPFPFKFGKDVGSHKSSKVGESLNTFRLYNRGRVSSMQKQQLQKTPLHIKSLRERCLSLPFT